MNRDSTYRTLSFDLARGDFDKLRHKAESEFGCSVSDLAKIYTLKGLELSGEQIAPVRQTGAAGRWANRILATLAEGAELSVRDMCAALGANHLTLRPVIAFLVAAGHAVGRESDAHRKAGRAPIVYRLAKPIEPEALAEIHATIEREKAEGPTKIRRTPSSLPDEAPITADQREALNAALARERGEAAPPSEWPEGLLTHNDASPSDLEDP